MSDLKAMELKSDEVLKTPEVEKQELTAEELSQLSGGTGGIQACRAHSRTTTSRASSWVNSAGRK
jgi:hypothetical protein